MRWYADSLSPVEGQRTVLPRKIAQFMAINYFENVLESINFAVHIFERFCK